MRTKFEEQLNELNQEMLSIGTMIEDAIQKAIDALIAQDVDEAQSVIEIEDEIDMEEKKIEDICFNLLLQQQPVARDLRVVSAAMKMVTDMGRIGNNAVDLSELTVMMSKSPYTMKMDHIKKMAGETMIMLIESIESYVERDVVKAQKVIDHDDVVDRLFDKSKADLIEMIRQNPERGSEAADMLMAAKYFERIGDHATNIAQWVIFSLDDRKRAAE
ncbi:MAG: phosphate signaling complex protein PhoU [Clostridiales bacterium]|nr:phosphate signaling complex protein PhoU [Clostridiales bacterium]